MANSQIEHLKQLRKTHERRLAILENQAAIFGSSTRPDILTEIEDIRQAIAEIDAKLAQDGPTPPKSPPRPAVRTILFLSADPTDAARLRLGEELREIQEKLRLSNLREQFKLESRASVRPADISQALLDTCPQIVHFSGHGESTGELCFENLQGEVQPVTPDALSDLFEQFASTVECVVLNACFSKVQADAIAQHIGYVIGMNQAIGDKAAIAFSIGFYQALGGGRTVEEAYKLGCIQIKLQGIPEHLTPALIKKG